MLYTIKYLYTHKYIILYYIIPYYTYTIHTIRLFPCLILYTILYTCIQVPHLAPLLCELTSTFLHLLQSHTQPNELIVIGIDIATSLIALDPQIHSITHILANLPLYNTFTASTYSDSPTIQPNSTSTYDKTMYTHTTNTNATTNSSTNNSILYKLQMIAVYILQCIYSQYIQYRKSILLDLIPVYTQVRVYILKCVVYCMVLSAYIVCYVVNVWRIVYFRAQ